ncbi:MAG: ABC transporter substrate-binding protein [Bilophila wadsworthia]
MRLNKFLSGLAAVLLAFSLCNAASAAPLTKIRTAWMDSYETFAMWYAKEKGWDKEAGLDIDILFFDSGMAILNALPAGEWQYSCLGGVPAMMGNLRYGTSVIGVGTDESACVAVLARPDNPVFKTKGLNPKHPGVFGSPEDVRGKTILCTTVSSAHFALTAWLDAVGVKPTEVTIKNMDQPQALAALAHRDLGCGPAHVRGTDKGKRSPEAPPCAAKTPLVLGPTPSTPTPTLKSPQSSSPSTCAASNTCGPPASTT